MGQRLGTLETIRKALAIARERGMPAERFDELRNLAVACYALPDFHPIDEWPLFENRFSLHWETDAELRLVAVGLRAGGFVVYRTADRSELATLPAAGFRYPTLSAD